MVTQTTTKLSSASRLLPVIVACLSCIGCGDAYSTQVPPQKLVSSMHLAPNFVHPGRSLDLNVTIFTPDVSNFITGWDFGPGIQVSDIDSGFGEGCAKVETGDIQVPDLFAETHMFPVCVYGVVLESADPGLRTISIELNSNGTPVIAREVFTIVPLPNSH